MGRKSVQDRGSAAELKKLRKEFFPEKWKKKKNPRVAIAEGIQLPSYSGQSGYHFLVRSSLNRIDGVPIFHKTKKQNFFLLSIKIKYKKRGLEKLGKCLQGRKMKGEKSK